MAESAESERNRMALAEIVNTAGVPEGYEGPTWDTEALQRDFDVLGFAAPFVVCRRKADGQQGVLTFVHSPRVYYDWQPS
jgi:hypothetical protein